MAANLDLCTRTAEEVDHIDEALYILSEGGRAVNERSGMMGERLSERLRGQVRLYTEEGRWRRSVGE